MKFKTVSQAIDKINLKKKIPNKIISTNQLKKLFKIEAVKYYSQKKKKFDIDENNKTFLNILCKYFAQDITFETKHNGDLSKGLFVYGKHGTGKTSSFKIIQNISRKYNVLQIWFPIKTTIEVVIEFNLSESNKKDEVINKYSKGFYMFDDLGSEMEASNYGKEDIFIRILTLRHNNFIDKGTRTLITSNHNFEEIKSRFGERVYDRLFEMFNEVYLPGESRR